MRTLRILTCLYAVTIILLATSFSIAAEPIVTKISVTHKSDHWLVEYAFEKPITAIVYGPDVMGLRSDQWEIVTEGLMMVSEQDEDRLEAEEPFSTVVLKVRPHDVFPPKNYVPTSGFSDGGSTLFLGFFMGDLVDAEGQRTLMDFTFELHARPGEQALMPEQVLSGYRVFAYFGPQKPVSAGFARLLIDPQTPAWMQAEIMSLVPAVTELFAAELNFELPQKPLIMIGAGHLDDYDGFSIKGGAINGHIMMSLRGKDLQDEKSRAQFQRLLTHEMAHLWQDGPAAVPLVQADPWLHEGGAEALALAALEKLKVWDPDAIAQYRQNAVSQCEREIGEQSLAEAAANGQWALMYSCGLRIFENSGQNALSLYAALIAEAVATNTSCGQNLFDRVTASMPKSENDDRLSRANAAYDAGRFADAGSLYQSVAESSFGASAQANNYYNAACSFSLAGDVAAGLRCLAAASDAGFRRVSLLDSDTDLNSLRHDARWTATYDEVAARAERLRNPAGARVITEDVQRFWVAHKMMKENPEQRAQILWAEYFSVGTNGLKDYYTSRITSVDRFLKNYLAKPEFYDAIEPQTLLAEDSRASFAEVFTNLDELYDDAVFPDIVFVIGRFSSMGTVSNSGLLISIDMLAAADGVPLHELTANQRIGIRDIDGLVPIVSHELIHAQQNVPTNSLLSGAIKEGGADFVAHLICGRLTSDAKYAWSDAREGEIWRRFAAQMHGTDTKDWLANAGKATAEWPAEMGYYVGYQICEAYYAQAPDKRQAIADILNCQDAAAFLKQSGYEGLWVD